MSEKETKHPKPSHPTIVLHIGEALGGYCKIYNANDGASMDMARGELFLAINQVTDDVIEREYGEAAREFKPKLVCGIKAIHPMLLESETKAAQAIAKEAYEALVKKKCYHAIITSSGAFRSALVTLISAGCVEDILVINHKADGEKKLSWLTEDGYLVNWDFGALEPFVEFEFTDELGFPAIRTPLSQRERNKLS